VAAVVVAPVVAVVVPVVVAVADLLPKAKYATHKLNTLVKPHIWGFHLKETILVQNTKSLY
jgi:hypothetical protein